MPFPNGLPKYKELTPEDLSALKKADVLNGCGPASWKGKGPNWLFKADCYRHDYNYSVGNTNADRRWADYGFYRAMIRDTIRLPWYLRPWARIQAFLFYHTVRLFGKANYSYTPQPSTVAEILERNK